MPPLHTILQVAFLLLAPPLLIGIIARVKARFAGRRGPPLLQAYFDIIKLVRKGSVFSRTTTWVFLAGPVVALSTALVAALLVPFGGSPALVSFTGDFLVLAYLLGLSRFFTMAAALDTGSAFEGMGAAREATYACLAEPALFLGFLALARATGSASMSGFLGPDLAIAWGDAAASFVLVAFGLFIVLLAENSRIPVDDPNTHLELTMIHEVMVLDHGGPAFGVILYGAALKLLLFSAIFVRVVAPGLPDDWIGWLVGAGAVLGVATLVGIVESTMARLRLTHIPSFLVAACLLCAFGVVLLVR